MSLYEVQFRVNGCTSVTQIQANDAAQVKKLMRAVYGEKVVVVQTKQIH